MKSLKLFLLLSACISPIAMADAGPGDEIKYHICHDRLYADDPVTNSTVRADGKNWWELPAEEATEVRVNYDAVTINGRFLISDYKGLLTYLVDGERTSLLVAQNPAAAWPRIEHRKLMKRSAENIQKFVNSFRDFAAALKKSLAQIDEFYGHDSDCGLEIRTQIEETKEFLVAVKAKFDKVNFPISELNKIDIVTASGSKN